MVAPFLISPTPRRVLVVEPSVALRNQVAEEMRSLNVLKLLGCLPEDAPTPSVIELAGRVTDWNEIARADIVVAHPRSISPIFYQGSPPSSDLFDLVIVDEAHHLPAPTWRAILDHFVRANAVLLTATPFRRDRKRIPGQIAFHYPVRIAIGEGIFNPITPELLPVELGESKASVDWRIAARAVELMSANEHHTSTLLIRGSSIRRAKELANLYEGLGIHPEILHSRIGEKRRIGIIERLRSGEAKAVAVIGMLGEGFDLPRLRVAAYHDKHRSSPSTVQLIGRLARVHPQFPQQSVLLCALDADVYPELCDAVRRLYEEDADWARVLPGLIDEEVTRGEADRTYAEEFAESHASVDPTFLTPLNRGSINEMPPDWAPNFRTDLPEQLRLGQEYSGAIVDFVGVNPAGNTLVVCTRQTAHPRWSTDPTLQDVRYGLTVISHRSATQVGTCSLLVENSDSPKVLGKLRNELGISEIAVKVDPKLVSGYLDSFDRRSISSIGLRAPTSYRSFLGRNVSGAMRTSDTARTGLGHVMVQVLDDEGRTITRGGATAKGKVWSTQYTSLRQYDKWVDDLTNRIWFPRVGLSGPILPDVSRGARLAQWPSNPIVSIDFAPELHARGWTFDIQLEEMAASLEDVTLSLANCDRAIPDPHGIVEFQASFSGDEEHPFWRGTLSVSGEVRTISECDAKVRRGFAEQKPVHEFLTIHPPSIYFLDGRRVEGHIIFDSRSRLSTMSSAKFLDHDWVATDISVETRRFEQRRGIEKQSIHETIEDFILASPKRGLGRRWVMCNDGKGELADYVVLEDLGRSGVGLEFWHAKAAGGKPGVRITDLQVVIAQALRSRQFIPSRQIWEKIHRRLDQRETPFLRLVDGSDSESFLRARLGFDNVSWPSGWRRSWRVLQPKPEAKIVIVQPGLSKHELFSHSAQNESPSASVQNALSLLGVVADIGIAEGWEVEVICSP